MTIQLRDERVLLRAFRPDEHEMIRRLPGDPNDAGTTADDWTRNP